MILSVALLSSAGGAQAHTYGAGIENSQWYVSASIFACSLTHSIPQFGQAVFHHEAGEKLRFHLNAQAPLFASGNAALVIEAPPWRPGQPVNDLGPVPVSRDAGRVVDLDHRLATQMIQGMLSGMMPTFTRKAWYGDETIRVRISGINFASFYQDYQNCVAGLLPVNFAQVERTSVLFGAGERELDDEDKALLDRVVLYVRADSTVNTLYVDGHTDTAGQRIDNRMVSQERAEAVTRYLVEQGIPSEIITTRYHGDRYPVASNRTAEGRTRNRRATVRLERKLTPAAEDIAPASQSAALPATPNGG